MFEDVNVERLTEVFDLVKPSPNWKYPISATVPKSAATADEIVDAVIWFAGGEPIVYSEGGLDSGVWKVIGAGYYSWIGA